MSTDSGLDIVHFRQRLLDRQQALQDVADTGEAAAQIVELDQTRVGRLSRMDALQGQAMSQEAQRRRQQERQRIAAALKRLDNGDYGYCQRCDKPIPAGRLEIDPSVNLCVACAEQSG